MLFEGANDHELMQAVRDSHPYPEPSLQAWMEAYAKRMQAWDGTRVRTTSVNEFVLDLQRCGELRIWEPAPDESTIPS